MARRILLKMSLCLAASLMITSAAKAQTINGDQGVAGLSYKIDQYFKMFGDNIGDNFDLEVQSTDVSEAEEVSETSIVRSIEQNAEAEALEETKEETKEESEFANIGISIAESYVRVREKASTDSEVAGKLYHGQIANIVKYQGDWVKIKSGNVEGYIMAEYLAIGEDAEAVIEENVSKIATVATETLKVREKKSVDSACLTLIPEGETYDVIAEYDKWVKISIDDGDIKGFVSKEFVELEYDYEYAISIEEEQAKLAAEEAARKAEEERLAELAAQQAAQQQANNSSSSNSNSSSSNSSSSNSSSSNSSSSSSSNSGSSSSSSNSSSSTTGSKLVSYALNFVGNPYVYGGTSLTRGADCSGFIQTIYRNFGYSLPRTSGEQSRAGRAVSLSSLQPGDILYYTSGGSVNHVAIYIGNGKVVHASNPRDGIKVSSYNYRTPAGARRIIG